MTHDVTLQARDGLGNRTSQPLTFQMTLDNVAPRVTVTQVATQLSLGATQTVLAGTATDGGPALQTWVLVETPHGDRILQDVHETGSDWTFDLTGDLPGRYLLSVESTDLVGNKTTVGEYAVDVTCTAAALTVSQVTAEPTDGVTLTLTLRATLANAGPESLPAGIPVGFYDANGELAALKHDRQSRPRRGGDLHAAAMVSPGARPLRHLRRARRPRPRAGFASHPLQHAAHHPRVRPGGPRAGAAAAILAAAGIQRGRGCPLKPRRRRGPR